MYFQVKTTLYDIFLQNFRPFYSSVFQNEVSTIITVELGENSSDMVECAISGFIRNVHSCVANSLMTLPNVKQVSVVS